MGEKTLEQRQMRRAQDWLEGKVPGSRRMVDAEVQTEGKLFMAEEVKQRVVNVSKAAVERALEERKKLKDELKLAVEEERRKGEEALRAVVEAGAKMVMEAKKGRKTVRFRCSSLFLSCPYSRDLFCRLRKPVPLL